MAEINEQDILDEIIHLTTKQRVRPEGAVTVNEYAARAGCSKSSARRWLDAGVEEGTMVKEVRGNIAYYWKVEDGMA